MLRGERDDPLRRPAEPNPSQREDGALMTHRVSEKQDFSKVCKSALLLFSTVISHLCHKRVRPASEVDNVYVYMWNIRKS